MVLALKQTVWTDFSDYTGFICNQVCLITKENTYPSHVWGLHSDCPDFNSTWQQVEVYQKRFISYIYRTKCEVWWAPILVLYDNAHRVCWELREMGRQGVCTTNFHTTSNKQKGEVPLCDWPTATSCLWLCSQKQSL